MIAAKHLDVLVGVDVHIVQPPGPVPPVPIPHPYVGIVLDPMDYVPMLGATVYVNGLPRAVAGTSGQATPPHIPMGGVFVKPPTSESEVFMGSMTVSADGDPLSRLGMPVLSCQDVGMPAPPRKKKKKPAMSLMLPTTMLMAIPGGPLVTVGGPPTIAMPGPMDAVGPLAKGMVKLRKVLAKKSKRFARAMRKASNASHKLVAKLFNSKIFNSKLAKKLGIGDHKRNRVHRAICTVTGHPVDVATGKVFTEHIDFELPGPIPLKWERVWYSTSRYQGPLGLGWHHPYDVALMEVPEEGLVAVRLVDGRITAFPALREGESFFDRTEKLTLERAGRMYRLRGKDGLTWVFSPDPTAGDPFVLVSIEDRSGNAMRFEYDRGRLARIIDSGGRPLNFAYDGAGRIGAITGPTPEDAQVSMTLVAYGYEADGCLAHSQDALGQPMRYQYQGGLLVREMNRNGLSFYFQWNGADERARCVRTWGDGGIYDHKLTYDELAGITTVVDSIGHRTTYHHRGGLVRKTVDALGAVHLVERNDEHDVLAETDPLGLATRCAYDERGNATSITAPDGAETNLVYDNRDLLLNATDPMGGVWQWSYDDRGRLASRLDPLGRATQYHWNGRFLGSVVDAAGHATLLAWDAQGNLVGLRTPDGGESQWAFDLHGRCTAARDPNGNVQVRAYDRLGRLVRVQEPDGNVRDLRYDPEGNVLHARDQQHDVTFAYAGMNRLVARTEAGTTVQFAYDTEEQLVGIRNEHGFVYRFVLGPTGEVEQEIGWDGLMRRYVRDKAGRVVKVIRGADEDERWSEYKHDPAGRVVQVTHADGTKESYAYRPDGLLNVAANPAMAVVFERDLLGRILKEKQGEHTIESRYDVRDLREGFQSSLGADVRIERNEMGDVVAVHAGGGPKVTSPDAKPRPGEAGRPVEAVFSARFSRDQLGLEVSRELPGGVRARWERDRLGRPVRQQIWSGDRVTRDRRYSWQPNDRLRAIVDAVRGPVEYAHDALGNLAAARYEDGRVDLRMPDAVGNLFRTEHRLDRKYGPAGQLLEVYAAVGATKYEYDAEGNLITKIEPDGGRWRYEWNAAGMLVRVVRPDGGEVTFKYDALGRRVSKSYRGKTWRWVWDGNVPLHEWVELDAGAVKKAEAQVPVTAASAIDAAIERRNAERAQRPSQGPPVVAALPAEGTKQAPVTWIFEPESFAPLAKLVGNERYSVVTDHLGTPLAMHDGAGRVAWSADIGAWGQLRNVEGNRSAMPFRWPGQYEDLETGLYYNRFRYYDPEAGQYASQDPIGLAGGMGPHCYASDPATGVDVLGLTCGRSRRSLRPIVLGESMANRVQPVADMLNAATFKPRSRNPARWKPNQRRWIRKQIRSERRIFDIGIDPARATRSEYYEIEQKALREAGLTKIRVGEVQVDVNGTQTTFELFEWVR